MKLPPTPEQKAWFEKHGVALRQVRPGLVSTLTTDRAKRCATCRHFTRHPFSPRYNYCGRGESKHTPNGMAKTTPNRVCDDWEAKA